MAGKVKIKAGPVEFEYEGETEFGVEDIKELFSHIETLFKVPALREVPEAHAVEDARDTVPSEKASPAQTLHISTIAARLDVKSGPDLIIAGAAALQIFEGKDRFTRQELLDVMKQATKHYNTNMRSNFAKNLNNLVGNKLNEIKSGVYSLTASEHASLEAKLVE
ncbi:hypothetical protein [Rhizobium sp. SSA_523]|uniref:hypothetical protein n=1 Tax=Rhizobium sp. SSA_523 TaxID=2952477 RepID=UPI002090D47B|nr:hypothetical protein [Rhizobium sp. SSA_523]MCO5733775.1 hypothetical protein [Rhizobium sp. SSA_523]WKC24950.1 hypothetical protein QTJ18_13160 [Rhizobium sp. SSA_523]